MSLKYEPASEPLHISGGEAGAGGEHAGARAAEGQGAQEAQGPGASSSLLLASLLLYYDTRVYEPQIRARLGTRRSRSATTSRSSSQSGIPRLNPEP